MSWPRSVYLAAAAALGAAAVLVFVRPDGPAAIGAAATQPAADAAQSSVLIGKPAPEIKLVGLDGATHTLAEAKGHVLVLDFWGVWCVPCHLSLPHLDEIYHRHSAQGLMVFAVDNGDVQPAVQKFVTETKLSLPILMDTDSKAADAYKVDEYPQTVVIGRDGTVKSAIIGYKEGVSPALLEKAITSALGE